MNSIYSYEMDALMKSKLFPMGEPKTCCPQLTSTNSHECAHCLVSFCSQCLNHHQHHTIKGELINMMEQIDEILKRFLHHAHSETEWTNHLTKDRKRLEDFIQYIEKYPKHLPILGLPNTKWTAHVNSLISKYRFAIHEDCFNLLFSDTTSSINPSTTKFVSNKHFSPHMCGPRRQRLTSS